MKGKDIYLTRAGYEKLREELEYLKTVQRRELCKEIEQARSYGDLGENAEYDAAKEAQALNEMKITELEDKLVRARIIDEENIPKDKVFIGKTVKLKNLDSGEELQYTLVAEEEASYDQGKISITSPIGKGLLGRKENETVEIKIPAGIVKYKIVKIT